MVEIDWMLFGALRHLNRQVIYTINHSGNRLDALRGTKTLKAKNQSIGWFFALCTILLGYVLGCNSYKGH